MATMVIAKAGYGGNGNKKPPRMVIKSASGSKITVYRSPRATSHTGDGQEWEESARAGRQSAWRRSGEKTPSYSMQITLGHTDWYTEVGNELARFISFARTKTPVTVTYSKLESGLFYITDFSYEVEFRSPFTNEPTRVSIDMTLTKAPVKNVKTGPISKAKPKPKPKPATKKPARKYKVKKGDTLWDLAQKYYGNPYRWTKLADANGVRNPRLLQIGKVLTIPYL